MNASRQAAPGEPAGPGEGADTERRPQGASGADAATDPTGSSAATDPIAAIEAALVTMRRDQGRRRLQRRAEGDTRRPDDETGGTPGGETGWGRGRWRGPHPHPHHHGHGPHPGLAHDPEHLPEHGPRALAHAARFRLLDALEASERPPSVSELADAIGVDQPRASRLVQAAVEAGHVRREADPSDARRSALVITSAGRELLASARTSRRSAVETALGGFTEAETAEFARLLARFVAGWPRD